MITSTLRPRRLLAVAAFAVSAALALTACTGPSSDNTPQNRSLTLSITGQPPSFDPAQADLGESSYIWTGIYDTLLTVDADGVIQPNAAEKWEYSADGLNLTLTLRDDLTFSDDSPVTAEDVAATIDRSRTTPGLRTPDLASVASVEAKDEHTVVLTLHSPDPALLVNLAMGAGIVGQAATLDDQNSVLNPVGSGPYVLDESATTVGATYVLNRRHDYWNLDGYPFEKVTIRVIADQQAQFNALQAGEIDALQVGQDKIDSVKGGAYTLKPIEATAWGGILFADRTGQIVPALGDERVRTAIAMAFDRKLYVDQLMLGGGRPTDQVLNPTQDGYVPELDGFWDYDVEAAKQLLADAGYPDGFDVVMPSTFLSTTFEPAVTQSLADIGIRVTWNPVPPQEIATSLSSGKYGLVWFFEGLNAPAIMTRSNFAAGGFLNPSAYTTPELTALFEDLAATPDQDAQAPIYQRINRYAVEHALVSPLFYSSVTWATTPGVVYRPNGAVPIYLSNFGAE